jgi:hypothetical protein
LDRTNYSGVNSISKVGEVPMPESLHPLRLAVAPRRARRSIRIA